jgi:hypothetical protein
MKKISYIAALLSLGIVLPAHAEEGLNGVTASFGVARHEQIHGFQVELGYRKKFSWININLVPLSLISYDKKNFKTRYSLDEHECYDATSGQFLYVGECEKSINYGAVLSADFAASKHVFIGAGIRTGSQKVFFSNVSYHFDAGPRLTLKYGKSYASVDFVIAY